LPDKIRQRTEKKTCPSNLTNRVSFQIAFFARLTSPNNISFKNRISGTSSRWTKNEFYFLFNKQKFVFILADIFCPKNLAIARKNIVLSESGGGAAAPQPVRL